MNEVVISKAGGGCEAAIASYGCHSVNYLAAHEVLKKTFSLFIICLNAVTDNGINAFASNCVVIIVCNYAERRRTMLHLDICPP